MLGLLLKYAEDNGLQAEPGFKPKDVRWALLFDGDGAFLEVIELGDVGNRKNRGRTFPKCPDLPSSEFKRGIKRSHFLIESVQVIARYDKQAQMEGYKATDDKVTEKNAFFLALLRDVPTKIPELSRVAESLADAVTLNLIRERLAQLKVENGNSATICFGEGFPVESTAWHDGWRTFLKDLAATDTPVKKASVRSRKSNAKSASHRSGSRLMRCFATGELVEPAPTHFEIRELATARGQPAGDRLISFDKESYRSYGLEDSANAAVSVQAASAYRASLEDLAKRTGQHLVGAKVVHWFKSKVDLEDDPLAWLEESPERERLGAEERARVLLNSIRTGERSDLLNNYYYALTMSGGTGRVMLRDWLEGQFEELVANIRKWFADLAIVSYFGQAPNRSPGIERVITSLLPPIKSGQKYEDWIKPIGWARLGLWHAAVKEAALSSPLICRLVILNRAFHASGILEAALQKENGRSESAPALSLLQARMGLIKAYHLRKIRQMGGDSMTGDVKVILNENHPSLAYHCGRLMAVLAQVQRRALGDVGAGIVQRYYAAASGTPALVLGRLTRLSQAHLNKLEGSRAYYEAKIADIWAHIQDGPPRTLDLEEQSLFALGYYQQIAQDIADNREKKSHNVVVQEGESNE
jgi:CRISPR-associated protein Csd1